MSDPFITNTLLVIVGLLVGALQAFVLLVLNGIRQDIQIVKRDLWEEIQTVKREHWAEIVRLRDRWHDLEKLEKTIVNFMQYMRERDNG